MVQPERVPPEGFERSWAELDLFDPTAGPSPENGGGAHSFASRDGGSADETAMLPGAGKAPAHRGGLVSAKNSSEGREQGQTLAAGGRLSVAGRSPALPDQGKRDGPLAPTDPRRLAFEDDAPAPDHAPPEPRDLGEFDFDI